MRAIRETFRKSRPRCSSKGGAGGKGGGSRIGNSSYATQRQTDNKVVHRQQILAQTKQGRDKCHAEPSTHAALIASGLHCADDFVARAMSRTTSPVHCRASTVPGTQVPNSLLHSQWGGVPLFLDQESPSCKPARRVLRTCFQAAHRLPVPPGVTNGVCLVGPNGVGKSTVLRLAEGAVRNLLPTMRTVTVDAADASRCTQVLDQLEERRWAKPLEKEDDDGQCTNGTAVPPVVVPVVPPVVVFLDNVHLLGKPAWRTLRNLLDATGPDGQVRATVCVVAAGDDHPVAWRLDWLQPLHEHMQAVQVCPLRTSDQYRAFRKHVQRHYHDTTHVAPSKLADVIDAWHMETGGRFAAIDDTLCAHHVCGARYPEAKDRTSCPAGLLYVHEAVECLCLLRKKMHRAGFRTDFECSRSELDPFRMDDVTMSRFELEHLVDAAGAFATVSWDRLHNVVMAAKATARASTARASTARASTDDVIDNLVASGILRATTARQFANDNVEYTFGYPWLALLDGDELLEWRRRA